MNDLTGGDVVDVIHRIENLDGNGTIDPATEVTSFVTDETSFGAPVDISGAVATDGSLYTLT